MADLFIDEYTGKKLAGFFRKKEKPPRFNPTTWDRLINAKLSAIAFEDYRVLHRCYPNEMIKITSVAD